MWKIMFIPSLNMKGKGYSMPEQNAQLLEAVQNGICEITLPKCEIGVIRQSTSPVESETELQWACG